ncbi:MAG: hypothetical protein KJ067_22140 [Vicinamibacteria bacterium]|nr:hypothetical protein [Vicinamibacteria bacterium]
MAYSEPPTFAVATVTVPQLNTLSEDIRYLKTRADRAPIVLVAAAGSFKAGTPANNLSTGWTYTLPGGTLANDGDQLRVTVIAKTAGAGNVATELKLKFGATSSPWRLSSDTTKVDGIIQWSIIRTGASAQIMCANGMSYATGAAGANNYVTPAETLTGDVTLDLLHGQDAGGVNYVEAKSVVVEFLPASA